MVGQVFNMKKNGFVATSVIYSFFIIFLLLMLFIINSYSRIRILLEDYKNDSLDELANCCKNQEIIDFIIDIQRFIDYDIPYSINL